MVRLLAAIAVALVLVGTASAAARAPGRVGTPVSPPETVGADGSGRLTTRVTAPGDGRSFALALVERSDIPLYAPGTVAECYNAGREQEVRRATADASGTTCTPPSPDQLVTSVQAVPPEPRLTARRYRKLRRAGRRLPGVTLLSGRVSAGVERVRITIGRRKRTVRPRPAGGGFLVAYRGWLEDTQIKVDIPGRRRATHVIQRATLRRSPGGGSRVEAPWTSTTVDAPASASSASSASDCPARRRTLVKNEIGRVWHRGKSLYACTTVYGGEPRTRRIGRYRKGTKVAFDGENAAYALPVVRSGVRYARVYAVNVNSGRRWMTGRKLIPATAAEPAQDARLEELALRNRSVAWVTKTGDVVLAMEQPASEPEPIGALAQPLRVDRGVLLVGSFDAGGRALADSMRYREDPGEGDECGATNPYTLTVKPDPSGKRVGVRWYGSWSSTSDVCT